MLWSLIFFPRVDTKSIPLIALSLSVMLLLQGAYIGTQPAVFAVVSIDTPPVNDLSVEVLRDLLPCL